MTSLKLHGNRWKKYAEECKWDWYSFSINLYCTLLKRPVSLTHLFQCEHTHLHAQAHIFSKFSKENEVTPCEHEAEFGASVVSRSGEITLSGERFCATQYHHWNLFFYLRGNKTTKNKQKSRLLTGCEEGSEIKRRQGVTKVSGILFGFEGRSSSSRGK